MSHPLPLGQGPAYRPLTILVPIEQETATLDEHAADIQQILQTDRLLDELRDGITERVSRADELFDQIRAALRLHAGDPASNEELTAQACVALGQAWENLHELDHQHGRINRVEAVLASERGYDSPDDLANAIRSALHPLSTGISPVESATVSVRPVLSTHTDGEDAS